MQAETDMAVEPSAVRLQVERLQCSSAFSSSDRLLVLLRFVVEEALNGGIGSLKESVIGNAVYGRKPPYDPRIDSTVRVEARRLRNKLRDYYLIEGRRDPVIISLPTGGYVPVFVTNDIDTSQLSIASDQNDQSGPIFKKGAGAALAIMPFRSLSSDPDDESFADGLTDELIFAMGRVQGLRVISRSTVFQYKDRIYSVATLASEQGVDAVLQGTVRREGAIVRATVEVSDPKGFVVWTDRFDASCEEKMLLQEQIATTMLSRFRFDSYQMRTMQISPGPDALHAMAKIYKARQLLDKQTPGALYDALNLFSEVNRSAPDYARGYSGIADCYCDLFRLGMIDHSTAAAAAKPAALRALEMDPQSIEANTAIATISAWLERDRAAAEAGFQKALKLGENARAARIYGVLLTILERHDEAERLFREARSIEPFSAQQDIAEAVSHYQARRFSSLVDAPSDKSRQRKPVEALVYKTLAHIFSGDLAGARSVGTEIEHGAAAHPDLMFASAEIEAWAGESERGLRLLKTENDKVTCFARATLAAALQDEDHSLAALDEAVRRRELSTVWMRTDARFDQLRTSKRFLRLLDGIPGDDPGGESPRTNTAKAQMHVLPLRNRKA